MFDLHIQLCDTLTSKNCSSLLNKLITLILYHSNQIPLTYEELTNVVRKSQHRFNSITNECETISGGRSYTELKALRYFNVINNLVQTCEYIFTCLESEFMESQGVKEVAVVIGPTVAFPKKIFRINIPNLTCCNNEHSLKKNLQTLCMHVITSDALHDYMKTKVGQTNIFIFIKMHSSHKPKTSGFLLNENFKISEKNKQMTINIDQPNINHCECSKVSFKSVELLLQNLDCNGDNFSWYQSAKCIKGFKNLIERGTSMFNILLSN